MFTSFQLEGFLPNTLVDNIHHSENQTTISLFATSKMSLYPTFLQSTKYTQIFSPYSTYEAIYISYQFPSIKFTKIHRPHPSTHSPVLWILHPRLIWSYSPTATTNFPRRYHPCYHWCWKPVPVNPPVRSPRPPTIQWASCQVRTRAVWSSFCHSFHSIHLNYNYFTFSGLYFQQLHKRNRYGISFFHKFSEYIYASHPPFLPQNVSSSTPPA